MRAKRPLSEIGTKERDYPSKQDDSFLLLYTGHSHLLKYAVPPETRCSLRRILDSFVVCTLLDSNDFSYNKTITKYNSIMHRTIPQGFIFMGRKKHGECHSKKQDKAQPAVSAVFGSCICISCLCAICPICVEWRYVVPTVGRIQRSAMGWRG